MNDNSSKYFIHLFLQIASLFFFVGMGFEVLVHEHTIHLRLTVPGSYMGTVIKNYSLFLFDLCV